MAKIGEVVNEGATGHPLDAYTHCKYAGLWWQLTNESPDNRSVLTSSSSAGASISKTLSSCINLSILSKLGSHDILPKRFCILLAFMAMSSASTPDS